VLLVRALQARCRFVVGCHQAPPLLLLLLLLCRSWLLLCWGLVTAHPGQPVGLHVRALHRTSTGARLVWPAMVLTQLLLLLLRGLHAVLV
jgi:hypothetical protein